MESLIYTKEEKTWIILLGFKAKTKEIILNVLTRVVKERMRNPKKAARKVGKPPLPKEERMMGLQNRYSEPRLGRDTSRT